MLVKPLTGKRYLPVLPTFGTASSSATADPATATALACTVLGWEQDLHLAFTFRHFHSRCCRYSHNFSTLHGRVCLKPPPPTGVGGCNFAGTVVTVVRGEAILVLLLTLAAESHAVSGTFAKGAKRPRQSGVKYTGSLGGRG